jgi:hypothetical protein
MPFVASGATAPSPPQKRASCLPASRAVDCQEVAGEDGLVFQGLADHLGFVATATAVALLKWKLCATLNNNWRKLRVVRSRAFL